MSGAHELSRAASLSQCRCCMQYDNNSAGNQLSDNILKVCDKSCEHFCVYSKTQRRW